MSRLTLQQAGEYFERLAAELDAQLRRAQADNLDLAFEVAQRLSSGPFSLAELARRDHPYATRHAEPLLDPSRINRQEGVFKDSWVRRYPFQRGGELVTRLYNIDPKAHFLEQGTRNMVARPLGDRLLKTIANRADKRIDLGIRTAIRRAKKAP